MYLRDNEINLKIINKDEMTNETIKKERKHNGEIKLE